MYHVYKVYGLKIMKYNTIYKNLNDFRYSMKISNNFIKRKPAEAG
jgi:hypothetical protein